MLTIYRRYITAHMISVLLFMLLYCKLHQARSLELVLPPFGNTEMGKLITSASLWKLRANWSQVTTKVFYTIISFKLKLPHNKWFISFKLLFDVKRIWTCFTHTLFLLVKLRAVFFFHYIRFDNCYFFIHFYISCCSFWKTPVYLNRKPAWQERREWHMKLKL